VYENKNRFGSASVGTCYDVLRKKGRIVRIDEKWAFARF